MAWLPDCEKKFEDIFIRFDRMYERDRQMDKTDGRTPHDGAAKISVMGALDKRSK